MEGGSFPRDFERRAKGALEVDRFFLWQLCEGNLKGGTASVLGILKNV